MNSQYSEQLQRLACLLFVLEEMPRRPARKQEVIEYIRQRHYLDIRPEDLESYITQIEPRWNTDIAFRRKDGVEWELMFNNQRDCWELTRKGIELLEKVKQACISKEYDVRECYLWTKNLKKLLILPTNHRQPTSQDHENLECLAKIFSRILILNKFTFDYITTSNDVSLRFQKIW